MFVVFFLLCRRAGIVTGTELLSLFLVDDALVVCRGRSLGRRPAINVSVQFFFVADGVLLFLGMIIIIVQRDNTAMLLNTYTLYIRGKN